MSFEPDQFRELIKDTLATFGGFTCNPPMSPPFFSKDAVELLMMTAAQETLLGKYIRQIRGPALGVFQMEPNTYNDLFTNYISHKPHVHEALGLWCATGVPFEISMVGNIPYQIIIARLFYLRIPEALPGRNLPIHMAYYYKKYWNTKLGKATPMEAYQRYRKYAF